MCQGRRGSSMTSLCAPNSRLRLKANLLRPSLAAVRLLEGSLFDICVLLCIAQFLHKLLFLSPHEAADDVRTALPATVVFE